MISAPKICMIEGSNICHMRDLIRSLLIINETWDRRFIWPNPSCHFLDFNLYIYIFFLRTRKHLKDRSQTCFKISSLMLNLWAVNALAFSKFLMGKLKFFIYFFLYTHLTGYFFTFYLTYILKIYA